MKRSSNRPGPKVLEARQDAIATLESFKGFLRCGDFVKNQRSSLSPAAALGWLRTDDVCDLLDLSANGLSVDKVEKAAKLLL